MSKKAYFLLDVLVVLYGILIILNVVVLSYESREFNRVGIEAYHERSNDYWESVFKRVKTCQNTEAC